MASKRRTLKLHFSDEQWAMLQRIWREKLKMADMTILESWVYARYRALCNARRGHRVLGRDRRVNLMYRKWLKKEGIPHEKATKADYMRFRRRMNAVGQTRIDNRVNQAYRAWLEREGVELTEATQADYMKFRRATRGSAGADEAGGSRSGGDRDLSGPAERSGETGGSAGGTADTTGGPICRV